MLDWLGLAHVHRRGKAGHRPSKEAHNVQTQNQCHHRTSRPEKSLISHFFAGGGLALMLLAGISGAAYALDAGPLDTTTLPRPPAVRQLAAFPQTTIIVSGETVPIAARKAIALLEGAGWQRYENPFAQAAPQATRETFNLKKGPHGLTVLVDTSPAQNNATVINYAAVPLDRDLPFPQKASNIKFAPERLHLDAEAPQAPAALLAYYRDGLAKMDWTLHSSSDGSAPRKVDGNEKLQHAFFTHSRFGALHVTATTKTEGVSTVAVRVIPASLLPGAQVPKQSETKPVGPDPQAKKAHEDMSKTMDALVNDLTKQALQPSTRHPTMDPAASALEKALKR